MQIIKHKIILTIFYEVIGIMLVIPGHVGIR